jgi:hypothetical protein
MREPSVTRASILLLMSIAGTALELAHCSSTLCDDRDFFHNGISNPERSLEVPTDAFLLEECRSSHEANPTSIVVKHVEGSESPIMIVDNFLGFASLQILYEDVVTRYNWNPYITNHVREYRKKGLGDDGVRQIVVLV